mmetsp:Transcript_6528/g.13220  ORF Transcript_6528/g.13220 Transcript_6528/m.13220 type:complete len:83 (-) Transcript_6528:305-553(-)
MERRRRRRPAWYLRQAADFVDASSKAEENKETTNFKDAAARTKRRQSWRQEVTRTGTEAVRRDESACVREGSARKLRRSGRS